MERLKRLKTLLAEVIDLRCAADVLEWEQQTYMPSGGGETRAQQFGTLKRLAHEKFTSDEIGQLLEELSGDASLGDYDSDDASLVRYTHYEYQRLHRVSAALTSAIAQHASLAQEIWVKARAEDNFALVESAYEKMFDFKRQYAEAIGYSDQLYDALLQNYEPGMKSADVKRVFAALRTEVVPLVKAILPKVDSVDAAMLHQPFEVAGQRQIGLQIAKQFGFDFKRGRLDEVAHPFCINFSRDDVRLTTRYRPDFLNTALFGTMHETGHGLYEQGVSPTLHRTPLSSGVSLAIHESQSRLWENLVGRSWAFWTYFYPHLQTTFPQLAATDLNTFYRAVNRVSPSYIRIEADELTYTLHIMLRFELEREIFAGKVKVAELPEAWRAKMSDYVGIVPETDSDGVLQDVHWSAGLIGYFATYALGTIISVQLFEKAQTAMPDLTDCIAQGDFSGLLSWLQTNIYQHGKKFTPMELLNRATGSEIDSQPYVAYLKKKFGEIYEL